MFTWNNTMSIAAYTKRLEFADGSGSDLFALLNAYKMWKRLRNQGAFGNIKVKAELKVVKEAERKWAEANYLEIGSLRECDEYVKDFRLRVQRMNLIDCTKSNVAWNRNEKYIVLKVVIAGAFYPNYFSRSTKSRRSSEVESFKALGGRDVGDTVYFSDISNSIMPHIYIKTIKKYLIRNNVISERDANDVIISHDGVASKLYVSFKKSGKESDIKEYGVACQPGFVLTEVYKAVKLRSQNPTYQFEVLT